MPWRDLVAVLLVAEAAVRAGVDVLALRALDAPVPDVVRDVYPAERVQRMRDYAGARLRFGLVASAVRLVVLLGFWLGGGFAALDGWTRTLGWGPVATGVVYLGALAVGQGIVGLPLRWWSTFVVEARFGFNRTTPRTFWADTAKGVALGVALGGPLLATVLWLFAAAGATAWLWCWALATAWIVVVQYVAPTWLLPLFHRCTPLADGPLRDAILAYAARVGFPLAGVMVIDGSRRSTKANAFFTGFGARKRIALFDTLLATLSPEEILAVLAHEVGHYRRRHVLIGLVLGVAQLGVTFGLLALVLRVPALVPALGLGAPSVHTALVAFALLSGLVDLPLGIALHALSRRHERQADAFAVQTADAGRALASALKTLAADSLSVPAPHPAYVAVHHTHPPLAERLRALGA